MRLKYLVISISILCLSSLSHSVYAEESLRNTPVVKVVKDWSPSVVNISTERVVILRTSPFPAGIFENLPEEFSRTIGTLKLKSLGSGVVISKDGLILTNMHVVQMASKVYVILQNGKEVEASLMAVSQNYDLALIKITPPIDLKSVKFANDVTIGETVIAVGNPFGLENSVTVGVVSGVNRELSAPAMNLIFKGLIQVDASINPGSSGGALFNLDGELVGINLAVVQNAQGIGFAIPFTKIKEILKEYEEAIKKREAIRIPVR